MFRGESVLRQWHSRPSMRRWRASAERCTQSFSLPLHFPRVESQFIMRRSCRARTCPRVPRCSWRFVGFVGSSSLVNELRDTSVILCPSTERNPPNDPIGDDRISPQPKARRRGRQSQPQAITSSWREWLAQCAARNSFTPSRYFMETGSMPRLVTAPLLAGRLLPP